MKRFICALLVICMVFVACDTGNNGKPDVFSIDALSIKDGSVRSLYVSDIPVKNSGRSVNDSTITTLSYINNLGQNTPFCFVTPSGKNIVLKVNSAQQLDNKRMTAHFSSYYEIIVKNNVYTIGETVNIVDELDSTKTAVKTALIDFERGKVYDFSSWDIQLIKDNIIIAGGRDYTIYKIDFNNISVAVPLNNSAYFPITFIQPKVLFGNKIIGDYVIDINNAFPVKRIQNAHITSEMCSFVTEDFEARISMHNIIQDLNGDVWFLKLGGEKTLSGWEKDSAGKYFIGKITINDNAEVLLTDCNESSFSFTPTSYSKDKFYINSIGNGKTFITDADIMDINKMDFILLYQDGFVRFERKASGIHVESVALSMPINLSGIASPFIQNKYLYYLEGTSIKRVHLSAGSSIETIYTDNRLLLTGSKDNPLALTPVEDKIIFCQFADDNTTVNTYSLALYKPNAQPELLSSVSANIRNIVELDF